mmetsp:Transcript_8746/g.9675  ORF Transcript_8746/g.9675 Transcript_8746/m.9675 type:complete len:205 (+) Transcript_8746:304-918(+)|eukprot:CAMPEP_0194155164 /NCGR_PEP_ID=MMETSP0152-20130528/63431_1 /TAXON_ID=1049557 /ORGANISM="Thalassiothrix antarctica, Strain L6-D1" /LENGTH=204 /DNA_ID=CAMNT_0038861795 /DNA_START=209 /DNA_END=823 /DNA_ORIENTATION=-
MGSNKNRKKKRISKHVIKSKNPDKNSTEEEKKEFLVSKPEKLSKKHKDPDEAKAYLSAWKYREQNDVWKFNKNTQSWLLRHMYSVEKISKVTFVILLEYMDGLQGLSRKRALDDAQHRALRYKKFEKELEKNKEKSNVEEVAQDSSKSEIISKNNLKSSKMLDDTEDDEKHWNQLNEHDKRKEYKRARKVIEILQKEPSALTSS